MELEKTIVQCCRERGKAFSQITLEDDYIIPDVRSDVIKIIHTQGELVFEEPKVSNQALWVSGKMNFHVLYRSEDSVRVIESVSGSLPFQEKLLLDGIEENDKIRISGKFEDVSAVLINSRKLAIRAVVNVLAVAETEGREEIVGALSMEGNCQQRQVEQKLLNLMDCKKDLIRVRREIKLPSSKANISEIIFKHVRIQNLEKGVTADGIGINAEAVLCILYRSEEDERIEWYETKTSFSGSMEDRRFRESDIFWIHVELASYDIDVRDDYDGEQRSLAIDFSVNMTANIWREEEVTVLKDVYSLGCELLPSYQRVEMEQFWMQTQARVRVGDVVHLEEIGDGSIYNI